MKEMLWVGIGGFAGSVLRYKIGTWVMSKSAATFPLGTLTVNLIGAFLIGLLVASALKSQQAMMLLLVTGFCGGFTTFSTFALENLKLIQSGNWPYVLTYIGISLAGGLGLCYLGYLLGSAQGS